MRRILSPFLAVLASSLIAGGSALSSSELVELWRKSQNELNNELTARRATGQERICVENELELFLTPQDKELSEHCLSAFSALTGKALTGYVRFTQGIHNPDTQRTIDTVTSSVTSQMVKSALTIDKANRRMKQGANDAPSTGRSLIAPGQPVTITSSLSVIIQSCATLEQAKPDTTYSSEVNLEAYVKNFFGSNDGVLSTFIGGVRSMTDEDGDKPFASLAFVGFSIPEPVSTSSSTSNPPASSTSGTTGEVTETETLSTEEGHHTWFSLGIAGALIALAALVGLLVALLLDPKKRPITRMIVHSDQLAPSTLNGDNISQVGSSKMSFDIDGVDDLHEHERYRKDRDVPLLAIEASNSNSDDSDATEQEEEKEEEPESKRSRKTETIRKDEPTLSRNQKSESSKQPNTRKEPENAGRQSESYTQHSTSPFPNAYRDRNVPSEYEQQMMEQMERYQTSEPPQQVLTSPIINPHYAQRGNHSYGAQTTPQNAYIVQTTSQNASQAGSQTQAYQAATPRVAVLNSPGPSTPASVYSQPIVVSQPLSPGDKSSFEADARDNYTREEDIQGNYTQEEYTQGDYTNEEFTQGETTQGETTQGSVRKGKKSYRQPIEPPKSPWKNFLGGFTNLLDSPANKDDARSKDVRSQRTGGLTSSGTFYTSDADEIYTTADEIYTTDNDNSTISDFTDYDEAEDRRRKRDNERGRDNRSRGRNDERKRGRDDEKKRGRDDERKKERDADRRREQGNDRRREGREDRERGKSRSKKRGNDRSLNVSDYADVAMGSHEFIPSSDDSASIEIQFTPRNKGKVEELFDDPPPQPPPVALDTRKNLNLKLSRKTKTQRDLEKAHSSSKRGPNPAQKTLTLKDKAKPKTVKPKGVLRNKNPPQQKQPGASDGLYVIPEDDLSI